MNEKKKKKKKKHNIALDIPACKNSSGFLDLTSPDSRKHPRLSERKELLRAAV